MAVSGGVAVAFVEPQSANEIHKMQNEGEKEGVT